jgi:hypothetical protein
VSLPLNRCMITQTHPTETKALIAHGYIDVFHSWAQHSVTWLDSRIVVYASDDTLCGILTHICRKPIRADSHYFKMIRLRAWTALLRDDDPFICDPIWKDLPCV